MWQREMREEASQIAPRIAWAVDTADDTHTQWQSQESIVTVLLHNKQPISPSGVQQQAFPFCSGWLGFPGDLSRLTCV